MRVEVPQPATPDATIKTAANFRPDNPPDYEWWSTARFADEQIRSLVRQLFFSMTQPVRQVVFSALEPDADVARVCRRAGESLSAEIKGRVAVLSWKPSTPGKTTNKKDDSSVSFSAPSEAIPVRETAKQISRNLWCIELENGGDANTVLSRICELRGEFDYSIVQGPPATQFSDTVGLGQLTDGLVLLLTAHKTKRAVAQKVKESLEAARTRILGTVLIERTFPIPAALYHRL